MNQPLTRSVALLLACTYFCFQCEFSEEEYEHNHPSQSNTPAISSSSLNWETFNKENVQQAFALDGAIQLLLILVLPAKPGVELPSHFPFKLIQDKSPPKNT